MWTIEGLAEHIKSCHTEVDGEWVPARPLIAGWRSRLRDAWKVFTGKADALVWPEGQ